MAYQITLGELKRLNKEFKYIEWRSLFKGLLLEHHATEDNVLVEIPEDLIKKLAKLPNPKKSIISKYGIQMDGLTNPFKKSVNLNYMEDLSLELFGDKFALRIAGESSTSHIKRPDLKGRAFLRPGTDSVEIHNTPYGTIIELK